MFCRSLASSAPLLTYNALRFSISRGCRQKMTDKPELKGLSKGPETKAVPQALEKKQSIQSLSLSLDSAKPDAKSERTVAFEPKSLSDLRLRVGRTTYLVHKVT